jgi:pimeloyl-ACP methyl ester carboxylesterase
MVDSPPMAGATDDADLPSDVEAARRRWSRRKAITVGSGVVGIGGIALALRLVQTGVLPGQHQFDLWTGGCDAQPAHYERLAPGRNESGSFYSKYRRREVGYTIGYPPLGTTQGSVPLVVMLHGEGGNHRSVPIGMSPAQAVALRVGGSKLTPMALVTVDGGWGYWHPHPTDDPLAMVTEELIPMCQSKDLGVIPGSIGVMGISMGGYGALLFAERTDVFSAVAAISPAIWTSYDQARSVNHRAYSSAANFAANDVVTHASELGTLPVRVACGDDDPFHPGVVALTNQLPSSDVVVVANGCHTSAFFVAQQPPSLAFLANSLAT